MVHMALRADIAGIADDLAAGAPRSHLRRRAALLERVVTVHHTGEDDVLLPALAARIPDFAPADLIEAQHADLDAALGEMRSLTFSATASRASIRSAVDEAAGVLLDHLATEERELLPPWLASFDEAEHVAFGRRLRRATGLRDVSVMVPWLLDAAPETVKAEAYAEVPRPIRAAYQLWWRRRFDRRYGARNWEPLAA
jgi:hypothetical protein